MVVGLVTVHSKNPLYTACHDWFLPFQFLTIFVWFRVFLLTTHWFVSCLATTTYLCRLCHSSLLDKEDRFVCLHTVTFLSTTVWVFFLAIPYGMHLVVPTHHSFFWVVCHFSKTSPQKEYEREPKNRLSFLPIAKSYSILPLTHDPLLLYWLGIGWQCLGFVRAPLPVYAKSLSAAYAFAIVWRLVCAFCRLSFTSYSVNRFLIFHFLLACSFQGLGLA